MVLPVNYAQVAGTIVVRTGTGSLIAAHGDDPVAFEADHLDEALGQGWDVLIRGHASRPATPPGSWTRFDAAPRRGRLAARTRPTGRYHHVLDPGEPPLPFRDGLRPEAGIPVPRHRDLHRPRLGQHRLGAVAVTGIPAVVPAGSCLP
jgi:hypothetical protein